jgi:hypothetical protein
MAPHPTRVYHSGTMLPPPLPPRFGEARDADTEPGVGLLALKLENARLRRALAEETTPPLPPFRASRLKLVGKWATVGMVIGLLAPVVEHYVPQYAAIIHELVKVLSPDAG